MRGDLKANSAGRAAQTRPQAADTTHRSQTRLCTSRNKENPPTHSNFCGCQHRGLDKELIHGEGAENASWPEVTGRRHWHQAGKPGGATSMKARTGSPEPPEQGVSRFLDLQASPEPRVPPPFPRDRASCSQLSCNTSPSLDFLICKMASKYRKRACHRSVIAANVCCAQTLTQPRGLDKITIVGLS